jgi:NADPH:quinone reductase-like Zn-dependent oxidoreductase
MKAYALTSADQPASLVDLPDPEAPAGGLVVRMRAAGVNGFDVYQANGYLVSMMPHDLPTVIGRDLAGIVVEVGEGRSDVAVGDEVIGFVPAMPPLHAGTWAELVAAANLVVARKPAGLSFEAAAAIPLAGVTALDALDAVSVGGGDLVLVNGATGGVGSFAVQLACQRGATVIATAKGPEEAARMRGLGADEVIDYAASDVAEAVLARHPGGVDVLLDLVNRDPAFAAVAALVRDGGRIATTMGTADLDALAARGVHGTNVMGSPTSDRIAALAAQVVAGTLRVEIQQAFPLERAGEALAAFAAGTRGKLVLVAG